MLNGIRMLEKNLDNVRYFSGKRDNQLRCSKHEDIVMNISSIISL